MKILKYIVIAIGILAYVWFSYMCLYMFYIAGWLIAAFLLGLSTSIAHWFGVAGGAICACMIGYQVALFREYVEEKSRG